MIESEIITPVVLASNSSTIVFPTDTLRTRSANCSCWLQHQEGSPIYKILQGGIYELDLSAVVTSATAGIVAIGVYQDGVLLPATVSAETLATAGDLASLSTHKAIRVCCKADTTITIASVPSVLAGATPVATATQIPTIINAIVDIKKSA